MTDYGHDLLFGSFITPLNQRPDTVVELAALSEEAGFDLVTFQDHPYQPNFLDTWTLMAYVAAATAATVSASTAPTTGWSAPRAGRAGRHLIDVHDQFRADLTQVRDLVDQVAQRINAAGDRAVAPQRDDDPAEQLDRGNVLPDLLPNHQHASHENVDQALVAFVGNADGAARLRSAVDLLTDTLQSHFAYEERELIEPSLLS